MKKIMLGLLLAVGLVMGVLAGCGQTAKNSVNFGMKDSKLIDKKADQKNDTDITSGEIQVGIVLPTKNEPRWLQDQKQFEEILGNAGFKSQVLFSQGSSTTEKTNVEKLIGKGIKVLLICAQDGSVAAEAVEEARDAGVKVIAYDRLITDTDAVDYFVTFDSFSVGAEQGQYLIDKAPSGTGIPLYLYAGSATDNNAYVFFEGAWSVLQPKIADGTFKIANSSEAEALKGKGNLNRDELGRIIRQITTDWDFSEANAKAAEDLAAVGPDLKGDVAVLAPNDGTSRAIADAFMADTDIISYLITGQDGEKASLQYVIDGRQSMTVFKDTRTLAADSVAMALDLLNGREPVTDTTYNNNVIDIPAKQAAIVVVTKENLKQTMIDSGYYEASDFSGL